LQRSWRILGLWGIVIAVLGVLGAGVAGRLTPMSLSVAGTPSARADAILKQRFGNSIPIAVLLQGPPGILDTQGPALARAFRDLPEVQVLSPWDGPSALRSTLHTLRPRPGAALILVSYIRPESQAMSVVVPSAERVISRSVRVPVHASISGLAVVGRAIQNATLADTHRAELIALPILIIVLLIVFHTPVAAAVPLAVGGATVLAGRGLLWLVTFVTPVNALGVSIAAMMGLALGVDYALLMVSRLRQELSGGAEHEAAVLTATRAAGRTIVFAGGTLVLAMLTATAVAAGGLLSSVALGVVFSGLLSVTLALSAMPALLRILGPNLDRWRLPIPTWRRRSVRPIGHPAIAIPLILLALFALASPAGALRMGPPDVTQLPHSDPARQSFEAVQRAISPGWSAPFVVVASAHQGVISTSARLAAISHWQDQVAREPDVAAVIGPGSLPGEQRDLATVHRELVGIPSRLSSSQRGIAALRGGLHRFAAGVGAVRRGMGIASGGAAKMGAGAQAAQHGAMQLHAGLGRALTGARRLSKGLADAKSGSGRLFNGLIGAKRGASRLASGLDRANSASGELAGGLDSASGGADRLVAADHSLSVGAAQLAQGMDTLDASAHRSLAPIDTLAGKLRELAQWIAALPAPTRLISQQLASATKSLDSMTVGRNDPYYLQAQQALAQTQTELSSVPVPLFVRVQGQIVSGLNKLVALAAEMDELVAGIDQLTAGAHTLAAGTLASEQAASSLRAGLVSLDAGAHGLNSGLHRLAIGGQRLDTGLGRLAGGGQRMDTGLERLQAGEHRLGSGLEPLRAGSTRLDNGLGSLAGGGVDLARALSAGASRAARLQSGVAAAQKPLAGYAVVLHGYQQDDRLLASRSPNALDSGYLLLTALDGTVSPLHDEIAQAINVGSGGQAARVIIIASSPPNTPATAALSRRLQGRLASLAATTGTTVGIGQGAQYLIDYTHATSERFPWLVLALAIVATLALILVLHALLLPLISVALNLATIAVAFGALQLLTALHVFGGPGYIDAVSAAGILAIMFVLSIDYEVFLLTRIRESWVAHGDADEAIAHGLRHTAGVITGAAAIMTGVFLAFASAEVVSLRQFGAGLALAVLLDATVVRLIVLPAIMRVLGSRVWWLPDWLDRMLPMPEQASPRQSRPPVPAGATN
jgi:RND superfamily putative drug exporter